jgi:hypothetical protein
MIVTVHPTFETIDAADWDRCLPDEVESYRYYRACHEGNSGLLPVAITVVREGRIIAVAPVMGLSYRLDTSLQGPLRRLTDWLNSFWDGVLRIDVIGLGSELAERCHIGFDPALSEGDKAEAFAAMMDGLRRHAYQSGTGLVMVKDLAAPDVPLIGPVLELKGYQRVNSLPVAVLDIVGSEADYLSSLSSATRKDIRRKLKAGAQMTIEQRHDISAIADEIEALYEHTRLNSRYDYDELETLPVGYFSTVSKTLGERAVFMLYRVDGVLIGFNLLMVEPDRVIDKFFGMRYPIGQEYNLYAVSWMTNVRYCIDHHIALLQTGQTAYAAKLRYGSRLVASSLYFHHRNRLLNGLLRLVAPWLAFDRQDPDLRHLPQQGEPR